MTTKEVAEILRISERRVRALIAAGILKAERPSRDWIVDPSSVEVAKKRKSGYPRGRKRK